MSVVAVNSPVKRESPIVSVLSAKYYPVSAVVVGTLADTPIVLASIDTGVGSYAIQTPLASVLAIATNFPVT